MTPGELIRAWWNRVRPRLGDLTTWALTGVLFGASAFVAHLLGLHGRGWVLGIAALMAVASALGVEAIAEGWHRLRHGPRPPARHKQAS